MNERASISSAVAKKTYRGVWAVLRSWFRVPEEPPTLPSRGSTRTTRPAPGFLRYLTFQFWVLLVIFDVALIGAWLVVLIVNPMFGAIIAIPVWIVAIVPDIVAYVAIHLRYDSTWYVISDRSMRLRRGIWVVEEVTITFENVQNVSVHQGPVQRYFGIANVLVQTAGGGVTVGPHGPVASGGHMGLLEGVDDAEALRDLIMDRVRSSRSAGLGDERERAGDAIVRPRANGAATRRAAAHGAAMQAILREIRDDLRATNLARSTTT
ncbi:MAG: PH domain-containing protein [Phycisphaerae bacterium]|nr:PH domain-containing protein [Phycisphaerae bacterium]